MTELVALVKVLNTGSREEVRATLLGLSAKERKTFRPIVRRSLEESARDPRRNGDSHALVVAATADSAKQARFIGLADPDFIGACVQDTAYLLRERNLGWLPQFFAELGISLGRQAALLLADPAVIGGRVISGFTAAAEADDAAVIPVLDALEQLLPTLPGRKDAGPFVELTAQLCQRTGRSVELPAQFQALAAGKASTVLAKALRGLL